MRSASLLVPGALALAAALSVAATALFGPAEPQVERGFASNTLYVTVDYLPTTGDPAQAAAKTEVEILGQVFEGLVRLHPATLAPGPGAAESWTVSDDGRVYTFRLRPGLRWSNGAPLVADHFVASVRRILDPGRSVLRTRPFIHLRGGRDYKRGVLTDFAAVGVSVPEPGVVRFELSEPYPHFLSDLAGAGGWPTPPGREGPQPWPDLASVPVNGPFRVESRRESRLILRRNPHYWSDSYPKLERTVLLLSSGQSTLEAMRYEAGAVHLSDGIAGSVAERSPRHAELQVSPVWSTFYLRFDTTTPPFDDARLRLALSLAIDRPRLAALRRDPTEFTAWSFVPPLLPDFPRCTVLERRRGEATGLFARYLADRGQPLPPLTLHFGGPGDELRQAALEVARSWRETLGIAADVMPAPSIGMEDSARRPLQIVGVAGSRLDPANFLEGFGTGRDIAGTRWTNEPYTQLILAARAAPEAADRVRLLAEAEELLLAEAPVAPVFFGRVQQFVHPRVAGWTQNPLNVWSLREVSFR